MSNSTATSSNSSTTSTNSNAKPLPFSITNILNNSQKNSKQNEYDDNDEEVDNLLNKNNHKKKSKKQSKLESRSSSSSCFNENDDNESNNLKYDDENNENEDLDQNKTYEEDDDDDEEICDEDDENYSQTEENFNSNDNKQEETKPDATFNNELLMNFYMNSSLNSQALANLNSNQSSQLLWALQNNQIANDNNKYFFKMLMANAAANQQQAPNSLYNTWLTNWITNMNCYDMNNVTNETNLGESKQPIINDPNSFELKSSSIYHKRMGHPYQNRNPPKRKKPRTSFNRPQIVELEKRFIKQKYLASSERSSLAKLLKMTDAQVKTWFQNRRTKWRRQNAEEKEAERQAANKLLMSLKQQNTVIKKPDLSEIDKTHLKSEIFSPNGNQSKLTAAAVAAAAAFAASTISAISPVGSNSSQTANFFPNQSSLNQLILASSSSKKDEMKK